MENAELGFDFKDQEKVTKTRISNVKGCDTIGTFIFTKTSFRVFVWQVIMDSPHSDINAVLFVFVFCLLFFV